METKYVVCVGNPFDGLELFGPFDDSESASEWAEDNCKDETWVIIHLSSTGE